MRFSSDRPSLSSLVTTGWSPARFPESSAFSSSGITSCFFGIPRISGTLGKCVANDRYRVSLRAGYPSDAFPVYDVAMPNVSSDVEAGHVVHLLERLDSTASAPQSLLLPNHLTSFGRAMFAFVNVLGTLAVAVPLYLLWSDPETPGWWFNLIFTVILGGIPVALWAILIGSGREAKSDRAMKSIWDEFRHDARAGSGVVLARETNLSEDGAVSSFSLTVSLNDGSTLSGRWRPQKASSRLLLQQQVPGVGAPVRVWMLADAAIGPGPAPAIIEVVDPSVVAST